MAYHFKYIRFSVEADVGTLILSRPAFHNALSRLLMTEMVEALDELASEPNLRLLILKGEGPSLCAGADLDELSTIQDEKQAHQYASLLSDVLTALDHFPVPVITLAHGAVYGGGVGLLAASDFVILSDKARLALSELKLGLIPAVISPYLVRKIGLGHARQLMLTSSVIDPGFAHFSGLVSHMVSEDEMQHTLAQLVENLLLNAPSAARVCKLMLSTVAKGPQLESVKEYTRSLFSEVLLKEEAQKGLHDFRKKKSAGKKNTGRKKE